MWSRTHQAVLSTRRWLLRGHHPRTSASNQYHQLSTLRSFGGAVSCAATDKLLLHTPSLLSASVCLPSLTRYGHVNQRKSDPLLISCHAYSNSGYDRPRVPMMKDLHSVEEVIVTAYEHLDVMSRSNIGALWTRIVQLISQRQPRQRGESNVGEISFEDMEYMLYTIFDDTTDGIEECNVRELTTIILGMAKVVKKLQQQGNRRGEDSSRVILRRLLLNKEKKPNRDLLKFLANASMKSLDQFDARNLSNLAYAYALIGYVPEFDDGSDLFDIVAMKAGIGKEFNEQDISNMVWAYATVSKPHTNLFEAMGDQVVASRHLNEFKPQALSNIVWAYAAAGINHPKLFEKVANHIVKSDHFDRFYPQALSNTVWAYATAGINHPQLFEAVANHIVEADHLNRFTHPQDFSNTVWAYATAGSNHPQLFEKMANRIVQSDSLDRFDPQNLANTLWAYATAGINHPQLFEAVANLIVQYDSLARFKPQELSNTVWACATAGINHPKLFEKIANHIVQSDSLNRFKPQELSNTVWAYATAGINHPKMFEKIANHIVQFDSLNHFNPQALSNTVWAYATAGINHPQLFEKISNRIVQSDSLNQFKPQNLANTVWAYATAGIKHPKMFEAVANHIVHSDCFNQFYPQDISNTVWAYATMGIINKQLYSSFVPAAAKLVGAFNNQEIANIAWACAVADVDAPALFNGFYINACVEKKDGFKIENLCQLYQWHLWQTKEKSNAGLPQDLFDSSYKAFISEDPTVSKLQDDVVSQLTSIGLDPQEEVLMDSGYRIDALVEVNGKTIGVEVDGPSHFIGKGRSPTGSTVLKRRQVPAIDEIELVSVPYWEWDRPGKNQSKKQDYLRKLLGLAEDN